MVPRADARLSGGPSTPVWFLTWAAYAAKCIMGMLQGGKTHIEVKEDAYDRYNDLLDEEALKLIQMSAEGGLEKNYYVHGTHKRLMVSAPWYSPYFYKLCSQVEWADLEMGTSALEKAAV